METGVIVRNRGNLEKPSRCPLSPYPALTRRKYTPAFIHNSHVALFSSILTGFSLTAEIGVHPQGWFLSLEALISPHRAGLWTFSFQRETGTAVLLRPSFPGCFARPDSGVFFRWSWGWRVEVHRASLFLEAPPPREHTQKNSRMWLLKADQNVCAWKWGY